jgi:hypothetical protein
MQIMKRMHLYPLNPRAMRPVMTTPWAGLCLPLALAS